MTRVHIALATGIAALATGPAGSHIVFDNDHGVAGSYHAGALRVGHGCGSSATHSIRVEIPEGIVTARPRPKAGWTLTIELEPLATPVPGEGGKAITERVAAIIWTGTLPADQFDEFGLLVKLPELAGPLYFPTRQICENGRNDWVSIPASPEQWHATDMPAPMLVVTPVQPVPDGHATHQ